MNEDILSLTREIALETVTMVGLPISKRQKIISEPKGELHLQELDQVTRATQLQVLRLLLLHYYVVAEYFKRTGEDATSNAATKQTYRDNVRALCSLEEFDSLYNHGENSQTSTCEKNSKQAAGCPLQVQLWMQ